MDNATVQQKTRTKEHVVYCVACTSPRIVKTQNYKQVKRCVSCQYKFKQVYNTAYVARRRRERAEEELKEVGFETTKL